MYPSSFYRLALFVSFSLFVTGIDHGGPNWNWNVPHRDLQLCVASLRKHGNILIPFYPPVSFAFYMPLFLLFLYVLYFYVFFPVSLPIPFSFALALPVCTLIVPIVKFAAGVCWTNSKRPSHSEVGLLARVVHGIWCATRKLLGRAEQEGILDRSVNWTG